MIARTETAVIKTRFSLCPPQAHFFRSGPRFTLNRLTPGNRDSTCRVENDLQKPAFTREHRRTSLIFP
jgi:hypothetical protein